MSDVIYIVGLCLIDLSGGKGRLLRLEHEEEIEFTYDSVGFLPDGDLILVSLNDEFKDYKIYKYSVNDKPTNKRPWKCSQIYDIEITESLDDGGDDGIRCFIYQTKLFCSNRQLMFQWDLSEMTFDTQYYFEGYPSNIVINKNQTLLTLSINDKIEVFSMETGTHISKCG